MATEYTNHRFVLTTAEIEDSLFYGEVSPVPASAQEKSTIKVVLPPTEKQPLEKQQGTSPTVHLKQP